MRRRSAKAAFCAPIQWKSCLIMPWPFAYQPLIGGNGWRSLRTLAPGIIATDAAERSGLALAQFTRNDRVAPARSAARRQCVQPDRRDRRCALDRYRVALAATGRPKCGCCADFVHAAGRQRAGETARVVAELSANQPKPVTSYMGAASLGPRSAAEQHRIPNYAFPERAISALAPWRASAVEREGGQRLCAFRCRYRARARGVCARSRGWTGRIGRDRGARSNRGVCRLPKSQLARSPDEAAAIAASIGFPVVMKISLT